MDDKDIFRKLTFGACFDFKRFQADAEKLKVCWQFAFAIIG